MSVFEGDDVADLQLVAVDTGDETLELQMVFDAVAGTTYRFGLGLPRDAAQVPLDRQFILMEWGETPENDDYADAAMLAGASGTVSGSNEFATNEKGEFTGALGDSSLWWTFEPEETGWMRFVVDGPRGSKLAVYKVADDGSMDLVTISRALDAVVATFRADAGARYVIRLGSYYYDAAGFGGAGRGDFELSWGAGDPPAMLRYVGSIADGQIADDGSEVDLGSLGDQAFNADGTELYVASTDGLVVFDRDPATGELAVQDTLGDYPIPLFGPSPDLIWDDAGDALIAASCDAWNKFTPKEGGGIEHAGEIAGAPCATQPLIVHGDLVHNLVDGFVIETYRFDEGHDAVSLEGNFFIPDLAMAVVTPDGNNMYVVTDDGSGENTMYVAERDADAGTLLISSIIPGGEEPGVPGLEGVRGMAVSDSYLYLSVGSGADTLVFDLADPDNPASLGVKDAFVTGAFFSNCRYPVARTDADAVDVACASNANFYTVQVGGDGSLMASDYVRTTGFNSDAFGNLIPDNDSLRSFGGSPDGGHLYVAGVDSFFFFGPDFGFNFVENDQILVFERVYEVVAESAEAGD